MPFWGGGDSVTRRLRAEARVRILFLSGWYPYPPDNGSKIRIFNLIKWLAARHELDLLSFADGHVDEGRIAAMERHCRSVRATRYVEFRPSRLRAVLGFLSFRPRYIVDTYSREMASWVGEAVATGRFDVVVASQLRTAPYALVVREVPAVFEEVELTRYWERFQNARGVARLRAGVSWAKLARFVHRLLRRFAGSTVVSEREKALVERVAPDCAPPLVVPNGVDLHVYAGEWGDPEPGTLVYAGSLTYDANFDAVAFFVREVWPRIKAQRPDALLRVTGRIDGIPPERLPAGEGIELTGYLDDVRPTIARSWVSIVPLRQGGGTRLKVLEAMALGVPVVSTAKGAEGLDVIPGKHLLIADEPAQFAQAVLRLLNEAELRSRLTANARQLVERYAWDECARRLEGLLQRVAEGKR